MEYVRSYAMPEEHQAKHIQSHLRNVYGTLTMALCAASFGGCLSLMKGSMGLAFIAAFVDLFLVMWLYSIPHSLETINKRIGILLGVGFCSGFSAGPLLTIATFIKPSLIVTAMALTAIVFAGFTAAALFSRPGSYLHLGGVCMSGLFYLTIGSFINIFFRSSVFFTLELFIGLAIFSGFIIYDTQAIIEKRKMGDCDFVA